MQALYTAPAKPKRRFRVLVIEPIGDFSPINWQDRPDEYRVIDVAEYPFRGEADTNRFLFNRTCLENSLTNERWTVTG